MNMIKLAREGVIPDVSAIMIDLDHFKNYNDRYGHSGGDTVLSTAAGVFLDHIRRKTSVVENERRIAFDAREFVQDVVGRAGGEEFIVVLPVCLEEAALVAERLRIALGSTRIDLPNVPEPQFVTGSFGVASLKTAVCIAESQNADMEQLLSIVDTAMYTSKNEGRNRVTVHRPCTSS
jgi:diguanylate cyclase (GGDEF)-like protein